MTSQGEIARQAFAASKVDPNWLRNYLAERVAQSSLAGTVPADGARYGIRTGAPGEWADMLTRLAYHESGLKNSTVGDVGQFGSGSRGLFQLSVGDAPNYGLNGGRPFSHDQLADPRTNADAAVAIASALVGRSGSIRGGMGQYWGPISREGWTPGAGRDRAMGFTPGAAGVAPPSMGAAPQQAASFARPNPVDPRAVEWAMNDGGQRPSSLGAMLGGGGQSAVPANAQVTAAAPVQLVTLPDPARFGVGQIAVAPGVVGDPLDLILSGQV